MYIHSKASSFKILVSIICEAVWCVCYPPGDGKPVCEDGAVSVPDGFPPADITDLSHRPWGVHAAEGTVEPLKNAARSLEHNYSETCKTTLGTNKIWFLFTGGLYMEVQ